MSVLDNYKCEGQISMFDLLDPVTWCGKTCKELSVPTKAKTSDVSSKKRQKSLTKMPLYLDLRRENGHQPDVSFQTTILWHGAPTIVSSGESHNVGKEYVYWLTLTDNPHQTFCLNMSEKPLTERPSKLSQILELNADPKYHLSARACAGILNRAERRGKKLPEQLRIALEQQSLSWNEQVNQGGGKGILIQNERTGSLQTNNSQAVCSWDGSQTAPTLTANNADGSQRMPDKDNFNAVISFTTEMTPKIDEEGTAFSLRSRDYKDPQSVVVKEEPILLESNQNHATIQTDGVSTCLPASMGQGGGYVPMVCENKSICIGNGQLHDAMSPSVEVSKTLNCMADPMKVVCIEGNGTRESHRGDGYKESETMYTLNTVEQHGVCVPETVDVEMEVSVRKYEVDKEKLKECLRTHRNMPIQTIAERLDRPKTLVEHWFRTDDSFAIPDPDVWMNLKALLGIDTDEFDKSIMTFETKPGNYDMRNRIHMGEVSPTLSTQGNDLHCVSYGVDSYNQTASEEVAETIRTNGGGDNLPKVAVAYGVDCYNQTMSEEQSKSLTCSATDSDHVPCVTYGIEGDNTPKVAISFQGQAGAEASMQIGKEVGCTLVGNKVADVCYGIDRASFNQGQNAQFDFSVEKELSPTIVSKGPGGVLTKQ